MKERNNANRKEGKRFELLLAASAAKQGVLPLRNGQQIRHLPGGRMIAIKSHLDWTLVYDGKVVFADTKSFEGDAFTFGKINEHQLELAVSLEERGIVAGFIVLFRGADAVCFFNGRYLLSCGKRTRFTPDNGMWLGQASNINVLALASLKPAISASLPSPRQTPAPQAATLGE